MDRLKLSSRLQFSLRTFLVISLIAAIPFIYLARQDLARRQLITDIESVGGTVKFDESITLSLFKSQRVTEVVIPHGRIAEVGMMRLKAFPNLSALGLRDFEFTSTSGDRFKFSAFRWTSITDELLKGLDSTAAIDE